MGTHPVSRRAFFALGAAASLAACTQPQPKTDDEAPITNELSLDEANIHPLTSADTKDWDSTYYCCQYASLREAKAAAEVVAEEIEAEGIVLLKNDANCLPLARKSRVSLMGRGAYDTVFGGTGAAQIDDGGYVSLADGLREAGFDLNDAPLAWVADNYKNYPRATVGRLDRPDTVTHYIGEIPISDYPQEVLDSLNGFEGHVVSDWSFYDYMDKNQAIYAGTDLNFGTLEATGELKDATSPTAVIAMRRAMKRYLFTLVHSNAVNGMAPSAQITGA